jgi:outer membrane receptor protein involved in Fe transport
MTLAHMHRYLVLVISLATPVAGRGQQRPDSARLDTTRSPQGLSTVVVTGTITPTIVKEVPHAITIVTAEQIRDRGVTSIDQLFRGEVPGLFAQRPTNNKTNGEAVVFSRGNLGIDFNTGGMKVYVDGVEMASATFFNALDPAAIERIEIIPGPEAANLYGSGALGGVMNIFLKKGRFGQRPTVRAAAAVGLIENNLSSSLAPQHDHTLAVSGGADAFSYSTSLSYNATGEWRPGISSRQYTGTVGTRLTQGWLIGEVSGQLGSRRTVGMGTGGLMVGPVARRRETGEFVYSASDLIPSGRPATLGTQTVSLSLAGSPWARWEQRLTVGRDRENSSSAPTAPRYRTVADSLYTVTDDDYSTTSFAYNGTFHAPAWGAVKTDVSIGADVHHFKLNSMLEESAVPVGTLTGSGAWFRLNETSHGYFTQLRVGVRDALSLTASIRAEDHTNYGADYGVNYAPHFGAAYAFALGPIEGKVRAAYGKATRPPSRVARTGDPLPVTDPTFGSYRLVLDNPDIGPEFQRGTEGGIDLVLAKRWTVSITRYDQVVDDVISTDTRADSVRSIDVDPATGQYRYTYQQRFENLGSVRNDGWEAQAATDIGSLTLLGTYSWTRSRVRSLSPRYSGTRKVGDSFTGLAEHTAAVTARYRLRNLELGAVSMWTGPVVISELSTEQFYGCSQARLVVSLDRVCTGIPFTAFRAPRDGYWMIDTDLTYRLTRAVAPFVRVRNATDLYRNEASYAFPTQGRVTMIGVLIN